MKLLLTGVFSMLQAVALICGGIEVKSIPFITVILSTVVLMSISAVSEEH